MFLVPVKSVSHLGLEGDKKMLEVRRLYQSDCLAFYLKYTIAESCSIIMFYRLKSYDVAEFRENRKKLLELGKFQSVFSFPPKSIFPYVVLAIFNLSALG